MPNTDILFHTGHRERLKEKLLDGQLADYEKLELLLTYAIPRRDVRPLARQLIQKFGSIYLVLRTPIEELMTVPGIGRNTAILIKLFYELDLVSYKNRACSGTYLSDEKFMHEYCRNILAGKMVEELHVLYLGNDRRLLLDETHTRGTINQTAAYPREIARKSIQLNAISVILAHNHPVSDNKFSYDDVELTTMIQSALQPIGVVLVDHLLVTSTGIVHSFMSSPWINHSLINH